MSVPNDTDRTETVPDDEPDGDVITTQVGPAAWVPAWILPGDLCPFPPDDRLTPGEVVIYAAMRSFADRQGAERARAELVASRAGCSIGSVHNAYTKFRRLRMMVSTPRRRRDGSLAGLNIMLRDTPPPRPRPATSPQGEEAQVHPTVNGSSLDSEGKREHPTGTPQTPTGSAAATDAGSEQTTIAGIPPPPLTPAKRAQALARTYVEAVPLSNFPAVMGVCRKAIGTGLYDDATIAEALARMARDSRPVTVDGLRIELEGAPAGRRRGATQVHTGGATTSRGDDPW